MAKIIGIPPFIGTYDGICIYVMYEQCYMRKASSLTGKKVKKEQAFRKTMQYAALLARASGIGSAVYALIPAHKKQHALYRKLTGEAMRWLSYQWTEEGIIDYLLKQYTGRNAAALTEPGATRLRDPFTHKTPRVRPNTRRKKRKIRQLLKEAARVVPFHYSLNAWRSRERTFRKEYNKALTEYPWAGMVVA